jgi:uncharacterized protein YozE (UPF0346 family)
MPAPWLIHIISFDSDDDRILLFLNKSRPLVMERLKPEELPEILTPKLIDALAHMANEFPKTTWDWRDISELLVKRGQLRLVLNRADELKQEQHALRESLRTPEGRKSEEEKVRQSLSSRTFSGNMGELEGQ